MTNQWARVLKVYTGLDADTARATLELEHIPVLVRGYSVGMFGSAFQGSVPDGVEILVPESELERARDLLGIDDQDE
jgi:hypothetical protein